MKNYGDLGGCNPPRPTASTDTTLLDLTYNNLEISLAVFMPNITTNHAITYTNIAFIDV